MTILARVMLTSVALMAMMTTTCFASDSVRGANTVEEKSVKRGEIALISTATEEHEDRDLQLVGDLFACRAHDDSSISACKDAGCVFCLNMQDLVSTKCARRFFGCLDIRYACAPCRLPASNARSTALVRINEMEEAEMKALEGE